MQKIKSINCKRITLIVILFMLAGSAFSQRICCTNWGNLIPNSTWQTIAQTNSGYFTFNATGGCVYTFSHCQGGGSGVGDTYLTIANNACGAITWNDDFCGLLSQVTWTAPATGTYQIHLGSYGGTGCDPLTRVLAYQEFCPVPMCYTVTSILYGPDSYTAGTAVTLGDDQFSGVIPIGFNFCFDGISYSSLLISSNNYITFNLGGAGGGSPYFVSAAIPSTADPMNAIMASWQDLYPPAGGTITYNLYGTAPNRRFDISWNQVPYYSCNAVFCSNQIRLFESTNCIEIHTGNRSGCSVSGIQGLNNSTGTSATVVPGRNYPIIWTASNDAYQISPSCAPCNSGASCFATLPIELINFTASVEKSKVHLKWTTASETNNNYFTIERTPDGVSFEPVANVAGAGNSSHVLYYDSFDEKPFPGTSYYRLKQTDYNGDSWYSQLVSINYDPAGYIVNVFPNPSDESGPEVLIHVKEITEVTFTINDMLGRKQYSKKEILSKGDNILKMSEGEKLPPGVYFINVLFNDESFRKKIVIK